MNDPIKAKYNELKAQRAGVSEHIAQLRGKVEAADYTRTLIENQLATLAIQETTWKKQLDDYERAYIIVQSQLDLIKECAALVKTTDAVQTTAPTEIVKGSEGQCHCQMEYWKPEAVASEDEEPQIEASGIVDDPGREMFQELQNSMLRLDTAPGAHVRFDGEGGSMGDISKAKRYITPGQVYVLAELEVGDGDSCLRLVDPEFGHVWFNAVMFSNVDEQSEVEAEIESPALPVEESPAPPETQEPETKESKPVVSEPTVARPAGKMGPPIKWTEERIKTEILSIYNRGESIAASTMSLMHSKLYNGCVTRFGNYRSAIEACGLDYDEIKANKGFKNPDVAPAPLSKPEFGKPQRPASSAGQRGAGGAIIHDGMTRPLTEVERKGRLS